MAPAGYWHQSRHGNCFDIEKFFASPRKKYGFTRLCPNKRFTHTYLQAVSLRLLVSCQMIIYRRFKSGFYAKQMQSFPNFVRFVCTCSTVWFCKLRSGYLLPRKGAQTPPEADARLKRRPDYIYSHDAIATFRAFSHDLCKHCRKWPLIRPLWN